MKDYSIEHYIKLAREYESAADAINLEKLALEGMKKFPNSASFPRYYASSAMLDGRYKTALSRNMKVLELYPDNGQGYARSVRAARHLGDIATLEEYSLECLKKSIPTPHLMRDFAHASLCKDEQHTPASFHIALERALAMLAIFPNETMSWQTVLSILDMRPADEKEYTLLYEYFLVQFLNKFCPVKSSKKPVKPICLKCGIVAYNVSYITFFVELLRYFSPQDIDIILLNRISGEEEYFNSMNLKMYNIRYGKGCLNDYNKLILNSNIFQFLDHSILSNKQCITMINAVDSEIYSTTAIKNSSLILLSSKNQNSIWPQLVMQSLPTSAKTKLEGIDRQFICETAYTGPYHIGKWEEKRNIPRAELFDELSNYVGRTIDISKPLVVVYEDEISHPGQIVRMINKLVPYASVIYKTLNLGDKKFLEKLDNNVILFSRYEHATNIIRFSADFILAGFHSGTFLSSIMLGLNVIPYYSRIIQNKCNHLIHPHRQSYYSLIPKTPDPFLWTSRHRALYYFNRLFDLLDYKKILLAIKDNEYLSWYHANLPNLQKKIFGDFIKVDATEKTADMIKKFFKNGTLGDERYGIYFKF